MRYIPLKTCSLLAIMAPVAFAILWICSATLDGGWTFGEDSLSAMGISENRVAAALFNVGCVSVGLAGALVGLAMIVYEKGLNLAAGAVYCIGMVFLMLVGVFPMDLGDVHYFAATSFGVFFFAATVLTAVTSIDRKWLRGSTSP